MHRDIKPANVMLTPRGEVKVMDFGIARALTGASSTMTADGGRHRHRPVPLARSRPAASTSTHASDIYSTGCLLFELLTGEPPFTGESPVAVAYQHVREDPATPSSLNADIPAGVDAVVLKAMAKNPANRYQTAAEMRADLDRAVAGQQVLATPVLRARRGARRRRPPPTTRPATTTARPPPRCCAPPRTAAATAASPTWRWALRCSWCSSPRRCSPRGSWAAAAGRSVATPDLIGQTRAQAAATLQAAGLGVGNTREEFSPEPVGTVIDQDPVARISLKPGATVDLVVSKGIEQVQVPDLATLTLDQARARLEASKLRVGTLTPEDTDAPSGTVLRSDPAAGATLPAGSTVNLVVASGKVAVPDVRGQDVGAARQTLEAAGFLLKVTSRPDGTVAPNTVLEQSPVGGTAERGSTVELLVAAEPPPSPSPTPSPTPSASPTPSPTPSASPSIPGPSPTPSSSPTP